MNSLYVIIVFIIYLFCSGVDTEREEKMLNDKESLKRLEEDKIKQKEEKIAEIKKRKYSRYLNKKNKKNKHMKKIFNKMYGKKIKKSSKENYYGDLILKYSNKI